MELTHIHSKDGRVTICLMESKGEQFKGIARCNSTDEIKPEVGDLLAKYRAELAVRKHNLDAIRIAKAATMIWNENTPCKLYDRWYQEACATEKAHLKHIRILKKRIKDLCNEF